MGKGIYSLLAVALLLLLGSISTPINAQQYKYRHITPDDGLPSTTVYRIIQDSKGFIWMGTDAGVCRYDGNKFQTFTVKDGLPDNEVLTLYEDKVGRIWFNIFKRPPVYFYHDSIFSFNPENFFDGAELISIVQAKDSAYWFATGNKGLLRYKNSKCEYFNTNTGLTNNFVILNESQSGEIWMTTYSLPYGAMFPSPNKTDPKQNEPKQGFICTTVTDKPNKFTMLSSILENDRLVVLDKQPDGYLYYFGRNKLLGEKENGDTSVLLSKEVTGKKQIIMKVNYDHDNNFLVGTSHGAYRISRKDTLNKINLFKPNFSINDVLEDREYNLWFTTLNDGIYFLSKAAQKVDNYGESIDNGQPQLGDIIADSQSHKMFFGSINGSSFSFAGNRLTPVYKTDIEKLVSLGHAVKDKNNITWCGSTYGIYAFAKGDIKNIKRCDLFFGDMVGGNFLHSEVLLPKKYNAFRLGAVKSIAVGKDNTIWVSSFFGVYSIKQDQPLNYVLKQYVHIRSSAIWCDQNSKVWFGTASGLCYLDNDTLATIKSDGIIIPGNITDIQGDKNNVLWITTSNMGIYTFKNNKILQHISVADGLSSDGIFKIRIYDDYALTCGKQGINKIEFDGHSHITKVFPLAINDGLASREVNDVYKEGGKIYAATNLGLSVFDEASLFNDTLSPLIYLSRVKINEHDTAITSTITLPYNRNNISIEYVGLFFKNKNLLYRYKMDRVNGTWVETRFTNIQYPTLPPGSYTFTVDARSVQGQWSGHPVSITFIINPPYWKTWWFRILAGLFFIGSVAGIAYTVFNYYRNRNEVAKKLVLLEGQALRAQMNPHFIFNSLNAIHDFIADHDQRSAHLYLSRFAALIRRTLDLSRKPVVNLNEELETVKLYLELEVMRFQGKIDYEIKLNVTDNPYDLSLPAMLLQPYLENAIRHGLMNKEGKGHLTLEIIQEGDSLRCIIADNGIGRKAADQHGRNLTKHRSHAMDITGERMNIFNEEGQPVKAAVKITDLIDEDGNALGTQVELTIPLNKH